ncbi:MAG: T9SS type A sorting domain-containing protein [Crocinitomicaceae bacterium]
MIQIPDPCNEDFSKMTETERGAFCEKCSIDTFDFTRLSTDKINQIIKNSKGEHICGRITNQQLAELNAGFEHWKKQSRRTFQSKFVLALVMVFGLTLFACEDDDQPIIQNIKQTIQIDEFANPKLDYINQGLEISSVDLVEYVEEVEITECFVTAGEIAYEQVELVEPTYTTGGAMILGGVGSTIGYTEYLEATLEDTTEESILAEPILATPDLFEAKAFPNPTTTTSQIEVDIKDEGIYQISMYNMNGQLIRNIHNGELFIGRQLFDLNLEDQNSGLYIVTIVSEQQTETLKVQKVN